MGVGTVAFTAFVVVDKEVLARDVGADRPVVKVGRFEALQVDQVGVPVVEVVASGAAHAVVELVVAAFKGAAGAVVVAIVWNGVSRTAYMFCIYFILFRLTMIIATASE